MVLAAHPRHHYSHQRFNQIFLKPARDFRPVIRVILLYNDLIVVISVAAGDIVEYTDPMRLIKQIKSPIHQPSIFQPLLSLTYTDASRNKASTKSPLIPVMGLCTENQVPIRKSMWVIVSYIGIPTHSRNPQHCSLAPKNESISEPRGKPSSASVMQRLRSSSHRLHRRLMS